MAPLDSVRLTAHFTRAELGYDAAPVAYRPNLERLAHLLERVREALGVPLRVTSAYRSVQANASLPGASSTSQHLTGQAADVVPVGLSMQSALAKLAAVSFAGFGQLIVYPLSSDHLHISLPAAGKLDSVLVNRAPAGVTPVYQAVRLADSVSVYAAVKGTRAPAGRAAVGVVVVLAVVLVLFLWRR